jgi:uncharacterized protein YkwD
MNWFRENIRILILVVLAILGMAINQGYRDYQTHQQKTKDAKEAARVSADPLTESQLLKDVNKYRADHDVAPLAYNDKLTASAHQKCADMVQNKYYGHDNPTTGQHGYHYIVEQFHGYVVSSENLNQGKVKTSGEMVRGWASSKAHREAMLSPVYNSTGLAVCTVNGLNTVVEHFAQL